MLQSQHLHARDLVDLLKSRVELGPEPFRAFQEWKAAHPIPDEPLVSVCVATYNRAGLLVDRCLASIRAQTYRRLDVVVVGDGCTDDTAARIAALDDPRIRFVNRPERATYPAEGVRRWMVAGSVPMNEALDLAHGDLVTHLDDDDEFAPERITTLVDYLRSTGADFVWHPFWNEDEAGNWRVIGGGEELRLGTVTTSAIFYRAFFTRIHWDVDAHLLMEPGDWNRIRRIKYLGAVCRCHPEPLTRHYRERNQKPRPAA
jgi:glycosyltransferase involved in cell wall biosynthesis